MNNLLLTNILRFMLLIFLQILVFKQINIIHIGPVYPNIFIYPLFLLLLPLTVSRELLLLIGFVLGLTIDWFYDSWGLHASACVFLAFIRPFVLRSIEPKGGYNTSYGLTIRRYEIAWFLRYCAWTMLLFLAFYYSMEVFTPVFILEIALKTLSGFVASMLFIIILMLIFNPMD
ncbi:MAG: hypothetical protein ACOYOO_05420 [Saprospiraceae bacterium]|jgi:hypothetical protein